MAIALATLSVADTLSELLLDCHLSDIGRYKEALLQREEAKTHSQQAEARKRVTEAAEAANKATQNHPRSVTSQSERAARDAETERMLAEADSIRMDGQAKLTEAKARFLAALSQLKQEGGQLPVSQENLDQILRFSRQPT